MRLQALMAAGAVEAALSLLASCLTGSSFPSAEYSLTPDPQQSAAAAAGVQKPLTGSASAAGIAAADKNSAKG